MDCSLWRLHQYGWNQKSSSGGKILQAHPNFQLQYVEPTAGEKPGSGNGIKMLINDEISIALSSRPLKDAEIERAKIRGFSLEAVPIAIDGIALYVNPQVAISGLTLAQLKDIYTGKITNWNQVGGSNLEIKAFSRDPNDGGTPEYFKEHILAGENFASSVAQSYVRDQTDSIQKTSATPGAIAYGTAAEVCNQSTVRSLPLINNQNQPISPCDGQQADLTAFTNSTYPITRQLFVIIKRNGRDAEAAGVAYAEMFLSQEGQQLVQEAGLVPIRR
ncbi:MAG: PstS family phosphate ABC transporter substrate-binding protein [Leptolyngbyaceae cyanobacterium CRU_2_3]|nr:PstS family phosphate ABC transporter substrate-binding protein [Leptolyngbyaceae cyanobacterium CRU_2_3]